MATEEFTLSEILSAARVAAQERRLADAALLLDQALSRDPNNIKALDLFGFVRYFQKRYFVAEGYNREVLCRVPDHAYALKGLGLCLARTDRLEEGLPLLRRAIELRPTWADPYWDLAVVLSEVDRKEEAISVIKEAMAALSDYARFEGFLAKLEES